MLSVAKAFSRHIKCPVKSIDFATNFGTSLFQPQSNLPDSPRWGHIKNQNTSYLPPPWDRSLIKSPYMPLLSPICPGSGRVGVSIDQCIILKCIPCYFKGYGSKASLYSDGAKYNLLLRVTLLGNSNLKSKSEDLITLWGRQILMTYTLPFQRFKSKFIKLTLIYSFTRSLNRLCFLSWNNCKLFPDLLAQTANVIKIFTLAEKSSVIQFSKKIYITYTCIVPKHRS